jgi:voltage-gated potassium channel
MSAHVKRALGTVVLIGSLLTIPLVVLLEEQPGNAWVRAADWGIWAIFLVEYLALLVTAPNRSQYIRGTPVNALVVVLSFPLLPALLGLVRLARLIRFLRFLRLAGVTAKGIAGIKGVLVRRGFVYVAMSAFFLVLAGGTALAIIEPQTVRGRITDGICWALFTVTTVGYNDVTPATIWGRMIGVFLMLTSVGLISTLAASITASFLDHEEEAEMRQLREQVTRIENLLADIAAGSEHRPSDLISPGLILAGQPVKGNGTSRETLPCTGHSGRPSSPRVDTQPAVAPPPA